MFIFVNPASLRHTLPANNVDDNLRKQMDRIRPDAPSSDAPLDEMRKAHANPLGPNSIRKSGDAFPAVLSAEDQARVDSRRLIASARPLGAGVPRPTTKVEEVSDHGRGELARAEVVSKAVRHYGPIVHWTPGEGKHEPRYADDGSPVEKRSSDLRINLDEMIKPLSDVVKSFRAQRALVRECTDPDHDFTDVR